MEYRSHHYSSILFSLNLHCQVVGCCFWLFPMQKAKAEIADRDKQLKSMIESQMDRTASQRSTHDSQSVRREKEQSMAPIRSVVTGKILAIKITASSCVALFCNEWSIGHFVVLFVTYRWS